MAAARVLIGSSLVVALAACGSGGGGDDGGEDDGGGSANEVTAAPADTTTAPPDEPTGETPATTTAPTAPPSTGSPGTTAATVAPTTVPAPEPIEFDLATLPSLVERLGDLSAVDPLAFAIELGFPLEIGVPDGSTLYRVDQTVTARDGDDGTFNAVGSEYTVIAPDGTIPDVDIDLDDNGPGSVQITEIWDPIMTDLGYERKNSTTSDPGDPGGPNTVNHVYVPTEGAAADVNGTPADIGSVFVWGDEDVTGASYRSDSPPLQGGYRIDLSADVAAGAVPVPILASLIDVMPVPDDAAFADASLRLIERSPDSFDANKGPNYIEITLVWTAAPGVTPDQLATFYAEAEFDGSTLIAAEVPLSGDGPYRIGEVSKYGDTDYRLPVLLLSRYGGQISMSEAYDAGEPAEITYRVTLNPTDTELAAPE